MKSLFLLLTYVSQRSWCVWFHVLEVSLKKRDIPTVGLFVDSVLDQRDRRLIAKEGASIEKQCIPWSNVEFHPPVIADKRLFGFTTETINSPTKDRQPRYGVTHCLLTRSP
ncbi:hypothetical protein TNCT_505721 [Trichonephila clavata]|uniref:Uncharacterized protein n=1 Tax=Trichonephila clavata TaxID=2740835 RepID=A0A8X6JP37_TRICU|nr:hypothetical protein TNCT_505721 [Trichonephila clavata]